MSKIIITRRIKTYLIFTKELFYLLYFQFKPTVFLYKHFHINMNLFYYLFQLLYIHDILIYCMKIIISV